MKKNKNILPYAGLVMAMFFWSISYVWVKDAYKDFTPIGLTFSRLIISAIILWGLGLLLGRINKVKKETVKYLVLLAFFEPFLYFLGESFGLQRVSPTTGSVIIATIPLFVSFASFIIYKERLPWISFVGALISFSGVIVIIFSNGTEELGGQMIGLLLMFMAVFSIIGYSMLINKISAMYSPFTIITYQNTIGVFLFAPLFFIYESDSFSMSNISWEGYQKLFLLAVFASSIAYILFVDGIRQIGVSRSNYFINIIPVFVAIFAIYSGYDSWKMSVGIGIFLTVSGLFISQFKGSFVRKTLRKLLRKDSRIITKNIKIEDYNYKLPEDRIAKYPMEERDLSKLLSFKGKKIKESVFSKITEELPENSLLVFNNTKVIKARLFFEKKTGAVIEIFCLEPYLPKTYEASLQSKSKCQWKCLVGNLKRWKSPAVLEKEIVLYDGATCKLCAEIVEKQEEAFIIQFSWDANIDFSEILTIIGKTPIPPYLNRKTETIDETRYQTVFSKHEGSVAAPTAGLHFTPKVLRELEEKGISQGKLTLHVGAGTFKPVKADTIGEHYMHTEYFSFSKKLLDKLSENTSIIAVGTTSVRSLESLYYIGVKLLLEAENPFNITQWECYNLPQYSKEESLDALRAYMKDNNTDRIEAKTDIMIAPGYQFQIISGLITNFHQPQSTLLLLVSALVGDKNWRKIYKYAMEHEFRFLSYGDSSILFKE